MARGRWLTIAAGGALAIVIVWWFWPRGQQRATLSGHTGPVWALAIATDGEQIASAGEDGRVRLWTTAGQSRGSLSGHEGPVHCVAFSPTETLLASGGEDRQVRLWEWSAQVERAALVGHTDCVTCLAFSP